MIEPPYLPPNVKTVQPSYTGAKKSPYDVVATDKITAWSSENLGVFQKTVPAIEIFDTFFFLDRYEETSLEFWQDLVSFFKLNLAPREQAKL